MAAEDILLEGSHGCIAMWPSNRGEVALAASLGDTAVEYLLGEVAAVLVFAAGSDVSRGEMWVTESFCSNGLATVLFGEGTRARRISCSHYIALELGGTCYIFFSDHTFLVYAFNFGGSISKRGDRMMMTTMCHSIFRNVAEVHSYEQMNSVYVCAIAVQL